MDEKGNGWQIVAFFVIAILIAAPSSWVLEETGLTFPVIGGLFVLYAVGWLFTMALRAFLIHSSTGKWFAETEPSPRQDPPFWLMALSFWWGILYMWLRDRCRSRATNGETC